MKQLKELIDTRMETFDTLSRKIGTTKQTLFKVINNKGTPSILTVKKICKYFKVNYKDYI